MEHVIELIKEHGDWFYLVTFIWTALEGETFVIFAALAAQRELLNVYLLFLAAWLGSFCGDQVYFFLGRRYGTRMIKRWPETFHKRKLDKIFGWLERYSVGFILSYRFMYGIRNISGVAIGMSNLPWKKFAMLNFIAAFMWALSFCAVGYLFGSTIEHLGKNAEEEVNFGVREFMLGALFVFAVYLGLRLYAIRKKRLRDERGLKIDLTVGPDDPTGRM